VTLLMPTGDKLANLDPGVPRGRRVPPGLAALAAQFPGLLAGTPGAADFVEDLVRRAGHEDAYLVNLAVVLSRERRIHPSRAAQRPPAAGSQAAGDQRRVVTGQGTAPGRRRAAVIRTCTAAVRRLSGRPALRPAPR